jgi:hypothetical protein
MIFDIAKSIFWKVKKQVMKSKENLYLIAGNWWRKAVARRNASGSFKYD